MKVSSLLCVHVTYARIYIYIDTDGIVKETEREREKESWKGTTVAAYTYKLTSTH